jgi:hypothetical protein
MKTLVTFESSAFNTSDEKDYFINPGCFGDDVAKWLMSRLRAAGVQSESEPGQEDFGWYFEFEVPEGTHSCVLSYRPGDGDEPGVWIAWLERSRGLVASLFGGRNRGISQAAAAAIHRALSGADEIANVRWHEKAQFDRGREELGAAEP